MWFGKYRSGNRDFIAWLLGGLLKRNAVFTVALPAVSGLTFLLKTYSGSSRVKFLKIFLLK